MKIEWSSSFRTDGSRRRPPPSSMHGWLAKMRGTLLGDEKLRSKGIWEMREASAARKRQAARKKQFTAGSGFLSFFRSPPSKIKHSSSRVSARGSQRSRQTASRPKLSSRGSRPSQRSVQKAQVASHGAGAPRGKRPSIRPQPRPSQNSSHRRIPRNT